MPFGPKPVRPAIMRSRVFLLLFSASLFAGCGGCGGVPAREGARPYRACLLESGETPRTLETKGGRRIEIEERLAHFGSAPLRIAAFRGAPGHALDEMGESVREERVDLLLLLGSLGRERREIQQLLEAVLAIGPPLLLIPGGDDSLKELDRAIGSLDEEARKRLLDGRRLHAVIAAERAVVVVPGAPDGRFAYNDDACGYRSSDLKERIARGKKHTSRPLALFAWAAEGGANDARTPIGAEAEGIFAFPAAASGPGRWTVGPIAGEPYFSGNGYRPASASLFHLETDGLRYLGEILRREEARMVRPAKP